MARILLLDDDKAVTDMLKRIVEKTELGTICGAYNNPQEVLENIEHDMPDIVLSDLLMPGMDGITFIKEAKDIYPSAAYVMLSQVSDKQLLSDAYGAGIEFFINKPINSIEVVSVIKNVYEKLQLKRTMDQMTKLLSPNAMVQTEAPAKSSNDKIDVTACSNKLRRILTRVGITGQKGADDIIVVCEYYFTHRDELKELKLKDICGHFSDSPKSMEQRIRRAAAFGMLNLANLGIEDYSNDIFTRYAAALYGFDQVRTEMNYIQGKTDSHGYVKMKKFISALVYASIEE